MNDAQQAWVNKRIEEMKSEIERAFPLSEEQWDRVGDVIGEVIALSKNNPEVRGELFDFIEPYDMRAKQESNLAHDGGVDCAGEGFECVPTWKAIQIVKKGVPDE